jgi:hypothetical protein
MAISRPIGSTRGISIEVLGWILGPLIAQHAISGLSIRSSGQPMLTTRSNTKVSIKCQLLCPVRDNYLGRFFLSLFLLVMSPDLLQFS